MKYRMSYVRYSLLVTFAALSMLAVSRRAVAQADSADVRGLPIVEIAPHDTGRTFVVFLSGDGGWADIDKRIAGRLAERGLPVVGLNLRDYLKQQRTPDEVSRDVARIMRAYGRRWNRERVAIVGFSRGANLAPFAVSRLPNDERARLTLVTMIGLNRAANFKWHFQDVFRDVKRADDVPTIPEIEKLANVRMLCVYGADEAESACRDVPPNVTRIERRGGHHLDGDYAAIADIVADAIAR